MLVLSRMQDEAIMIGSRITLRTIKFVKGGVVVFKIDGLTRDEEISLLQNEILDLQTPDES